MTKIYQSSDEGVVRNDVKIAPRVYHKYVLFDTVF